MGFLDIYKTNQELDQVEQWGHFKRKVWAHKGNISIWILKIEQAYMFTYIITHRIHM